jgi:hypothetical protein
MCRWFRCENGDPRVDLWTWVLLVDGHLWVLSSAQCSFLVFYVRKLAGSPCVNNHCIAGRCFFCWENFAITWFSRVTGRVSTVTSRSPLYRGLTMPPRRSNRPPRAPAEPAVNPAKRKRAQSTAEEVEKDLTPRRLSAVPQNRTPEPEEEDERSLLDPPVPPAGPPVQVIPQPSLAEVAGSKPRLTIHKMALVNFKSYAGRQEIGPFHKVSLLGHI